MAKRTNPDAKRTKQKPSTTLLVMQQTSWSPQVRIPSLNAEHSRANRRRTILRKLTVLAKNARRAYRIEHVSPGRKITKLRFPSAIVLVLERDRVHELDKLVARMHLELSVRILLMVTHRAVGNNELVCNIGTRKSLRRQMGHFFISKRLI